MNDIVDDNGKAIATNPKPQRTMNEQEFIERMKRAKSKVKDGLLTPVIDMLPEGERVLLRK